MQVWRVNFNYGPRLLEWPSCSLLVSTAFRDGNVIDLGPVQLQVVEACSGIRYLFPLTSLALLCAYLFKDRMWKRVVLVLSSIPISILVNGFRIGMIGVLVEWYGQGAAEGFYPSVRGLVAVYGEFRSLDSGDVGIGQIRTRDRSSFLSRFTLAGQSPDPIPAITFQTLRFPSLSPLTSAPLKAPNRLFPSPAYLCSVALLIPVAFTSTLMVERAELSPPRAMFVDFPMQLDGGMVPPSH